MRRLLRCLWLMGCMFSILLLAAACKPANPASQKFGGTWTMSLGDRTFLILVFTENGDRVTGTLARPSHFQVDASGTRFSQITSDEVKETITSAMIKDDHLRFMTANPNDQSDTSDYELAITGKDQASLKILTRHSNRGPSHESRAAQPQPFSKAGMRGVCTRMTTTQYPMSKCRKFMRRTRSRVRIPQI